MAGLKQRVLGLRAQPQAAPEAPETEPATAVVAPPAEPTETATTATVEAPAAPAPAPAPDPDEPWRRRSRMRRRLRYLRRARELALRDLGGLVFDLDRFGRERPDLVRAKLDALTALDGERRALETALDDHREVDVLREPGIASCPRCGALHASDAHFCSSCGLPVGASDPVPPGPTAVTTGDAPA